MGHRGHRDHSGGLLCGGHVAGVGGHHIPHEAEERGLQHYQHGCVNGLGACDPVVILSWSVCPAVRLCQKGDSLFRAAEIGLAKNNALAQNTADV